jgi:hypothetical protein
MCRYFSVITNGNIAWRIHIGTIKGEVYGTSISAYSVFKNEWLSATITWSLIIQVITYAFPAWEFLLKSLHAQNNVLRKSVNLYVSKCLSFSMSIKDFTGWEQKTRQITKIKISQRGTCSLTQETLKFKLSGGLWSICDLCSRIFHKNLTSPQLVKILPPFFRNPEVHYRIHMRPSPIPSWTREIQSMPSHPTYWWSILITSFIYTGSHTYVRDIHTKL